MKRIFILLCIVLSFSGCQTFPQPDNVDLNYVYAPVYARELKTKPEDPKVYFNIVRSKIYSRAMKIYFESKNSKDEGTVILKFRIKKNGTVEGIEVVEDASTANRVLRQIAIEAMQKSSPFPHFYKTIKDKTLDFTVELAFAQQLKEDQREEFVNGFPKIEEFKDEVPGTTDFYMNK